MRTSHGIQFYSCSTWQRGIPLDFALKTISSSSRRLLNSLEGEVSPSVYISSSIPLESMGRRTTSEKNHVYHRMMLKAETEALLFAGDVFVYAQQTSQSMAADSALRIPREMRN